MRIISTILNALAPSAPPDQLAAANGSNAATGTRLYNSEVLDKLESKPVKKLPRPYEHLPHVTPSAKAIQQAVKLSGVRVVSDSDRDKLVDLDGQYQRLVDFARDLNPNGARAAFQQQQKSLRERLAAAKTAEIMAEDHWSLTDFEEDFQVKARAVRENLRAIVAEASPITLEIRDRLADAATKAAKIIQREEEERAELFGMPHCPSNILISIGQLPWNLEWLPVCGPDGMTGPRPAEILRVIDGLDESVAPKY